MFFAVSCLHPSLSVLAPKDRVTLMIGTLGRFLRLVTIALVVIWASGRRSMPEPTTSPMPLGWHMMMSIALVMTLVFAYLYVGLFRPARRALAAGDMAALPSLMGRVRALVIANLILGAGAIAAVTMVG